jgi:hypothetical protein
MLELLYKILNIIKMIIGAVRRFILPDGDLPPTFLNLDIIDGATYELDDLPVSFNLYDTQVIYYNGNIYQSTNKQNFSSDFKKVALKYKQDKTYDLTTDIGPDDSAANYHSTTFVQIDNDGRMYLFFNRQFGNVDIYRADNIESVASFTKLSEQIAGISTGQYGAFYRNPNTGRYHFLQRSGTDYIQFHSATEGLENWSIGHKLLQPISAAPDDNWYYFKNPVNNDAKGYNHILVERRYNPAVGDPYWTDIWYLKTADWITFENIDGSYSKNIFANGYITEAQLEANFAVGTSAVDGNDFWAAFIDENTGYPYMITTDKQLIYWNGSSWVQFTLPSGYAAGEGIATPVGAHMALSGQIRIWSRAGAGTVGSPYTLRSHLISAPYTSIGTFEGTVINEANQSFLTKIPNNYWEIPKGYKFPCLVSSCKDGVIQPNSNNRQNDIQILWYQKGAEVTIPARVIPDSRASERSILLERSSSQYLESNARITNIEFTDGATDDPFTICLWMKKNNIIDLQCILEYGDANGIGPRYKFEFRGSASGTWINTLIFYLFENGQAPTYSYSRDFTSSRVATELDDKWHFVTITYDGNGAGGIEIYEDCIQGVGIDYTASAPYVAMQNSFSTDRLSIGRSHQSTSRLYFDGYLDEISIWAKELTLAEIAELYNSGLPLDAREHSAAADLRDYRRLDNLLIDDSGNANADLVNNNAATFETEKP